MNFVHDSLLKPIPMAESFLHVLEAVDAIFVQLALLVLVS